MNGDPDMEIPKRGGEILNALLWLDGLGNIGRARLHKQLRDLVKLLEATFPPEERLDDE